MKSSAKRHIFLLGIVLIISNVFCVETGWGAPDWSGSSSHSLPTLHSEGGSGGTPGRAPAGSSAEGPIGDSEGTSGGVRPEDGHQGSSSLTNQAVPNVRASEVSGYKLTNEVNESLSIRSIYISPFFDNVGGIFSKPLRENLVQSLEAQGEWRVALGPSSESLEKRPVDLSSGGGGEFLISPETFDENPGTVQRVLGATESQALVTGRISQTPQGFQVRLSLFVGPEGYLLASESQTWKPDLSLADLKPRILDLWRRLRGRLPYDCVLLSRTPENLVTFNLGSSRDDGISRGEGSIERGDDLLVIQVLRIHRHPKFHFAVGFDREILGKIRVEKVEKNLSFGTLVSERVDQLVQPGAKIVRLKPLSSGGEEGGDLKSSIPNTSSALDQELSDDSGSNRDGSSQGSSYGPSYGSTALSLGLSQFGLSQSLDSPFGGVRGETSMAPSFRLQSDLWITPDWFADVYINEYIATIPNSSLSSPSTLSATHQDLGVDVGYHLFLPSASRQGNSHLFEEPRLDLFLGLTQTQIMVDESNPRIFLSAQYQGLSLGLKLQFPLSFLRTSRDYGDEGGPIERDQSSQYIWRPSRVREKYTIGTQFRWFISPSLSEKSFSSGSSSTNQIYHFGIFASKRLRTYLKATGTLNFSRWNTSFTGIGTRTPGATSSGHTLTTLDFGLEFLY